MTSQSWNWLTSRQVAAIERELRCRAGGRARWKDKIDERRGTRRQPIEVVVAAAINLVIELEQILARFRSGKIEHRIGSGAFFHLLQLAAAWIEQHQCWIEARVNPTSGHFNQRPLPLFQINA